MPGSSLLQSTYTDSHLIIAVEILPGNAPDNLGVLELAEQSEADTGVPVEEAMGDAAYGDGNTKQAFVIAGRTLIARVPGRPSRKHRPKEDLNIWPGGGRLHLSGGECYPENPSIGYSNRSRRSNSPAESLPVRWSGLRGVPDTVPVRGRVIGAGTNGAVAHTGRVVAAGPGLAAE